QDNFVGWGQTVSLSAQLSGLRSLFQASYFDPYFLDSNFILSADLYRTETDFPQFVRTGIGGDINFGYPLTEDIMVNAGDAHEHVTVEQGTTGSLPLADEFASGVTSSIRLSATWDRRDNRLFPSKGFMHFVSAEIAPPLLGGDLNFIRYTAY